MQLFACTRTIADPEVPQLTVMTDNDTQHSFVPICALVSLSSEAV
jgi:hypothetical protein